VTGGGVRVPLLDLKAQYRSIKAEIDAAVLEVLESQQFILGPHVTALEEAVARYSGCAYGIGVSSGTDALLACLMAEGIGAGDEVITPAYSFFASAGAVARLGARPVFVDIDPASFNLEPGMLAAAVTPRTRAIIPVHLFGQMAPMKDVLSLSEADGLTVIEDAAQAIGAAEGARGAGSLGHYGCFSFFPSKNLGGAGDGGMVVTSDAARRERVRIMRSHGGAVKYLHATVGGNFRLDAIQAAVLNVKLRHLERWTTARQDNARDYRRLFSDARLASTDWKCAGGHHDACPKASAPVVLPEATEERRHIYNQFVIRVPRRDELRAFLATRGIGTEVYYPTPFHLQECFRSLGYRAGDFPASECAAATSLALPIYPELTPQMRRAVVDAVAAFFTAGAGRSHA
jgi:dTDP-4-amino-4,6-dideoxygalactose transaminase